MVRAALVEIAGKGGSMFGSAVLEVVVGVFFVFMVVSAMCTALRECLEAVLKTRAAYLEHGIRELLRDPQGTRLAKSLFEHSLIFSLFPGKYTPGAVADAPPMLARGLNLPSYIPARSFARALMDIAARGDEKHKQSDAARSEPISAEMIRRNIQNIESVPIQRLILGAVDSAQDDLDGVRKELEDWFNSAMERISGWYRRTTYAITLCIGLAVAIGCNINTIKIADVLYRDKLARADVVETAQQAVTTAEPGSSKPVVLLGELDALRLPIGWSEATVPGSPTQWASLALGWLVTALAATLGAPFWFDMLSKVISIRSTMKPKEEGAEVTSKERSAPETRQNKGTAPPPMLAVPSIAAGPSLAASVHVAHLDPEGDVDGSDIARDSETRDEDLPQAYGGVAA